jgi:MoaA/NifB/PqqE/SkfB family radical SAM enzyme
MANLVLCKIGRFLRLGHALGLPYRYYIDPINVCVLRCPLCPTGTGKLKRPRGRMKLEDLHRLVNDIKEVAYIIYLYNWGESLLHPDILEMIEYATRQRIFVRLCSNLNAFEPEMASRLVHSGLSQLVVSIDGASQETYGTYRVGGDLDRVISNLKAIIAAKHSAGVAYPRIGVRMLVTQYNEGEVPAVRDMVNALGIDTFSTGAIFVDPRKSEDVKRWLPTDRRFSAYASFSAPQNIWSCSDLWESCAISWDGGVLPCCWLHDAKDDFGNVFQEPIADIWNNPFYTSSRRVFGRFKRPRAVDAKETVCTRCRGHPDYDY